jgi:type I restriction enzyme, R subunit
MWMTGFDVPCCSTIYLDKPMRNHTLIQTIARANRVAQDKVNSLIVDYVGIFRDLQNALAIYAAPRPGGGTDSPIQDKKELVEFLRKAIAEAKVVQFLLETLKREKLALDWRKRQQTRRKPIWTAVVE